MNNEYIAKQFNRAIQLTLINNELPDDELMEVADIFSIWEVNKQYRIGDIIKYGLNKDNETQLYLILQDHISQDNWFPDITKSLYKAIGITDEGYPIWTQPYGATDAYMLGDKVSFENKIYESIIDNNTWSPTSYPQGWKEIV